MTTFKSTETIREYQDIVVTLRQDVAKLYKGLLMKECQVASNNLSDAQFDIPRQDVEVLKSLHQIDLEGTRLRENQTQARSLFHHAQLLKQCVQKRAN